MNFKKEVPVIPTKDIIVGNPSAPVTLTEFGDYESESLLAAHEVVKEILNKYEGSVKFNFRHFPLLAIHQRAHKAAEAAIAAGQDGKFWEMHEVLLHNRKNLGTISLTSYAREVGIPSKGFLDSLVNGKYGWNVQDDLAEGLGLGIRKVPSFFINGKRVEGEVTVKNISAGIEEALGKKRSRAKAA